MVPRSLEWVTLRLDDVGPRPNLAWAQGERVSVATELLEQGFLRPSDGGGVDVVQATPCDPALADALRLRVAFTDAQPLSSRLPFSYQRVSPKLRSLIAKCMGYASRGKAKAGGDADGFPAFPLDLSTDFLADLAGGASPFRNGPTPVILSHDLDSLEGLKNFLARFAALEEAVGAHSVNYVPARAWPLDHARLSELRARGHEVGVHGFDHSNRTAFLPQAKREARLEAACTLCEAYGANGYRAPSLLRTQSLLASLVGRFQYDSSIPTSGGRFPVPGNGCATARPFLVAGIAELPLSMPRDGSLRFLGYEPEAILALWLDCAARIAASGGVVVVLTHCEERFSGNPAMLQIYRRLLERLASDSAYFFSSPAGVLRQAGLLPARNTEPL